MRGSIVGLNFDTSIDSLATLYYAAMEFIALQTRHIIETLGAGGHEVGSVFMAGGGMCRNEVLLGLLANATGRAVVVPEYVDKAVVVGAAMLGVKAASADGGGRTVGLWEVMRGMAKRGRVVCPEAEGGREGRLLDVKYRVYLRMGEEQRRYREMVKEEMGEWEGESE